MYQGSLQDLIDALGKLPGIGPKSAQRLAFYFLQTDPLSVENLARLLVEVKQKVKSCKTCGAVSETEICNLCNDTRRDQTSICVVEEAKDKITVQIEEVDIDENTELAKKFNIRGVPTLVMVDDAGNTIKAKTGYLNEKQLLEFVNG